MPLTMKNTYKKHHQRSDKTSKNFSDHKKQTFHLEYFQIRQATRLVPAAARRFGAAAIQQACQVQQPPVGLQRRRFLLNESRLWKFGAIETFSVISNEESFMKLFAVSLYCLGELSVRTAIFVSSFDFGDKIFKKTLMNVNNEALLSHKYSKYA